jgi:hypothetical protein
MQAEAVQKLRSKLSFFRVAGTDEAKARRMFKRDSLALDHIAPCDRNVEQQINQMVFKQVYFVNVKEAAISARQQTRLKSSDALFQCTLDVDGSTDAIFCRPEWQFDDGNWRALLRQFHFGSDHLTAFVAQIHFINGIATI